MQCQKILKTNQRCRYKINAENGESPFCKRHTIESSTDLLLEMKKQHNNDFESQSEQRYNACVALEEKKWKMISLKSIPQPEQRSLAWFELRKLRITASEAAKCIYWDDHLSELREQNVLHADPKKYKIGKNCNAYETKNYYMCVKAGILPQPYIKEEYVQWGVKYEPIATSLYEYLYKTTVHDFGLLPHPHYDFIGASPDGISDDLVMLEIKCPKTNRDVGPPVIYYWIQMQMQMEVANLDVCDFFDVRIREYDSEKDMLSDEQHTIKGVLLELYDFVTGKVDYYYPTFSSLSEQYVEQYVEIRSYIQSLSEHDVESYFYGRKKAEMIYWYVDEYACSRIHRDRKWFHDTALPQLRDTWNDIMRLQKGDDVEFISSVMPKKRTRNDSFVPKTEKINFFQGSALASSDEEEEGEFPEKEKKIIFLE